MHDYADYNLPSINALDGLLTCWDELGGRKEKEGFFCQEE